MSDKAVGGLFKAVKIPDCNIVCVVKVVLVMNVAREDFRLDFAYLGVGNLAFNLNRFRRALNNQLEVELFRRRYA